MRRRSGETPDLAALIGPVRELAHGAGQLALGYFGEGRVEVDYKSDRSPVTAADRAAHERIVAGLERLKPPMPVLSEESDPETLGARRDGWAWHWLVDPLDGTWQFIRGRPEFTVNIALIRKGRPVLGVVDAPALDERYFGYRGGGAFCCEGAAASPQPIRATQPPAQPRRVLASGSQPAPVLDRYVAALGGARRRVVASSLKFGLLARGEADVYARMWPTSEWDTAAGQAILECAGGAVLALDGQPLRYGKPSTENPFFIACGDPSHDWLQYLS